MKKSQNPSQKVASIALIVRDKQGFVLKRNSADNYTHRYSLEKDRNAMLLAVKKAQEFGFHSDVSFLREEKMASRIQVMYVFEVLINPEHKNESGHRIGNEVYNWYRPA